MKTLMLLPVLLGLFTLPNARADQAKEDDAIRKRHDEWIAAWNKHDPHLMALFFVADGDLVNPFGRHAKGTAEIEKLFTHEQTGPMAGSTYAGTVDSIRYIGKDIAIVDVTAEITGMKGPDGHEMPPMKHRVTWIAEKKGGKWMAIAARAFVTMPPPPPPHPGN